MTRKNNNEQDVSELLLNLLKFKGKKFQEEARPALFEAQHPEKPPVCIEFCEYTTSSHTWKCGLTFSGFSRWRDPTPTEIGQVVEVLQPLLFASLWLERGDEDPYAAFLAHFEAEMAKLK